VDKTVARLERRKARLGEAKRQYLYTHARSDGSIFYVGLGTSTRSRFFHSRSPEHARLVAEVGKANVVVQLHDLRPGVSPYWQEQELIAKLTAAGHTLCNQKRYPPGRFK
jgi:hypothetical protein